MDNEDRNPLRIVLDIIAYFTAGYFIFEVLYYANYEDLSIVLKIFKWPGIIIGLVLIAISFFNIIINIIIKIKTTERLIGFQNRVYNFFNNALTPSIYIITIAKIAEITVDSIGYGFLFYLPIVLIGLILFYLLIVLFKAAINSIRRLITLSLAFLICAGLYWMIGEECISIIILLSFAGICLISILVVYIKEHQINIGFNRIFERFGIYSIVAISISIFWLIALIIFVCLEMSWL
jgi:hypothetical protein